MIDSKAHLCSLPASCGWRSLYSAVNGHERGADGRVRVSTRLGVRGHHRWLRYMRYDTSLQQTTRFRGKVADALVHVLNSVYWLPWRQEHSHCGDITESVYHSLNSLSQSTLACGRTEQCLCACCKDEMRQAFVPAGHQESSPGALTSVMINQGARLGIQRSGPSVPQTAGVA